MDLATCLMIQVPKISKPKLFLPRHDSYPKFSMYRISNPFNLKWSVTYSMKNLLGSTLEIEEIDEFFPFLGGDDTFELKQFEINLSDVIKEFEAKEIQFETPKESEIDRMEGTSKLNFTKIHNPQLIKKLSNFNPEKKSASLSDDKLAEIVSLNLPSDLNEQSLIFKVDDRQRKLCWREKSFEKTATERINKRPKLDELHGSFSAANEIQQFLKIRGKNVKISSTELVTLQKENTNIISDEKEENEDEKEPRFESIALKTCSSYVPFTVRTSIASHIFTSQSELVKILESQFKMDIQEREFPSKVYFLTN